MTPLRQEYEVLVLGAGPAGTATATLLARKGLSVLLLHKLSGSPHSTGETLSAAARDVLGLLEIDAARLDATHQPVYQTVSLWNSGAPIVRDSLFTPSGHGWNIDKGVFEHELLEKAKKAGVDYCEGTSIDVAISETPCEVSFVTEQGRQCVKCTVVADCTGRAHFVSRRSGSRISRWDKLVAINAILSHGEDDWPSATMIEAEEHGWWYSGTIGKGRRVVSFFTDARSPCCKQRVNPAAFQAAFESTQLLRSIGNGHTGRLSVPTLRSANSVMPERLSGDHWIAIGDAATAFDPLSSQGISSSLQMAVRAAEVIAYRSERARREGFRQYEQTCRQSFSEYLTQRQSYYASVQRWPKSAFWQSNSIIKPFAINE